MHADLRLCTFLSESVSVRAKSTDEAERNRMQAIKCVVVGDGYAIILLCLHCYNLSCLQVLNPEVLPQLMHDGDVWPWAKNFGLFDRKVKDFHMA